MEQSRQGASSSEAVVGGKRAYWGYLALVLLILIIFAVRMSIVVQTPYLSYDSYLAVRSVEHIQETGAPLRDDPLSVTGHTRIGNPVYEYGLALLTAISPVMYKVLPNLLMALLLVPVYLITRRLSGSSVVALVAAILAGTGPVLFARSMNAVSPVPLALLLILIIIALLHDIERHIFPIIFCAIALAFTHPLIFVLSLSLLIMIVLLRVEGYGVDDRLGELFFFTLLLSLWFYVLVYKNALFEFGIGALWRNVPGTYLSSILGDISLLSMLYGLGIITFLFGTFGMYHALFERPHRDAYLVMGPVFAIIVLIASRLIPIDLGITIITPFLAIMAAYGLMVSVKYIRRTKTDWSVYPLAALLAVFFVFSALLPALSNANGELDRAPSADQVATYELLRNTTGPHAVILTTVEEAAAVQYFSGRTTLTDEDLLPVHNSAAIVRDVDSVYTARFALSVAGKSNEMGFTHILFSDDAARRYGRDRLLIDEAACIEVSGLHKGSLLYAIHCGEAS